MSKSLVIVESPTKARTISRFLGSGVQVLASQGHIRDLPQRELGVDIANDFKPTYELTPNGRKTVAALKAAAASANDIYLATDPDREGEAIAWHLQEVLKGGGKKFHRITFHEITRSAIERSFKNPGGIAYDMVDAQQARRVLDRIVGYQVSPMLWRHIQKGTSAGRVQTVALRLVVEREKEIRAFKPVEYWNLDALFKSVSPETKFNARLAKVNEEKVQISSAADANRIADALQSAGVSHRVTKFSAMPHKKSAPPPFITSTLQQAAGGALRLSATQTMRIAQELYEGIDLGSGGQVGLITYMRTDSVNIAKEAQQQALEYIKATFGADYLPEKPNVYRSRKSAQEAHEAIRPTSMKYAPDSIASYLTPSQLKLYRLIWNRFIASQMAAAQQMNYVMEIESSGGALKTLSSKGFAAGKSVNGVACTFRASATETTFPGFLRVYSVREIGEEDDNDEGNVLPKLPVGTICNLQKLEKEQCFTQPPSRYTEAALVKALEQNGVGRPSTYATTVNTIQEREYVSKDKSSLVPTELGEKVCEYLVRQMPDLFDIGFTAQMEDELDQVEEGRMNWIRMLHEFYASFQGWLGGHVPIEQPPKEEALDALLACFGEDFEYDAPVVRGMKKYNDAQFIASIRGRKTKHKGITERQWSAFLYTIAKYAPRHPEMGAVLEKYGYAEQVRAMECELNKGVETPKEPMSGEAVALLKAMENVQYNPPEKRGKRVYDDAKFVKSLHLQSAAGRGLTLAQLNALLRIAAKYAEMIPDYQSLAKAVADKFGLEMPTAENQQKKDMSANDAANSSGEAPDVADIVAMLEEVKDWAQPSSKGHFKFDDKKFAESVIEQYHQKGQVSPKQLAALQKLVSKYKSQISNCEERMAALNIGTEKKKQTQFLDEVCPLCGAKLVLRFGRGSSFKGCSAFPKCRYSSKVD